MSPHRLSVSILLVFLVPVQAALAGTDTTKALAGTMKGTKTEEDLRKEYLKTAYEEQTGARIKKILDRLEQDGDFGAAKLNLRNLFRQVVTYAPLTKREVFIDAAFTLRLVEQLKDDSFLRRRQGQWQRVPGEGVTPPGRVELLKYLRANDKLARAIAFTVRPDRESPRLIYDLLDKLREGHGEILNEYAYLTAAICVVHEEPFERRVNENMTQSPEPGDILHYFVTNEKHMLFGLRNVPPELLVYVVDTTASVAEMKWALSHYRKDRYVGKRFFDIRYDFEHLKSGREKEVSKQGYSLPNILKYGGVCADQAYFAVGVGKSIGVPTCYTAGKSGNSGHAWVGYFRNNSGKAAWDFSCGRYDDYCVIRGELTDPQIRGKVPDDHVSVQAELVGAKEAERYGAIAFTDAARFLMKNDGSMASHPLVPESEDPPRDNTVTVQLQLIECGLRCAHGFSRGWLTVAELAQGGDMTLAQKKYWASHLQKMCSRKYPEFVLTVLKPMVATVADTAEQNAIWEVCFRRFSVRHDLAAEIRCAQAEMWERVGESARAGTCYADVIKRYVNSGPFAVTALEKTAEKLREVKREQMIPALYAGAWSRCKRPKKVAPMFLTRANWAVIGRMYATALDDAGQTSKAEKVRKEINVYFQKNKKR